MWSVFFVFLSYLDKNVVKGDLLSRALDAEKESKEMLSMLNGTFCAKMSTVRESFLYQVSDGAEVVRSVVSPAGKLVNCSVIANQKQVKSFMHECKLEQKEQRGRQLETRFARKDEAKRMCREFKESSERSGRMEGDASDDSALQDKVLKRSKRGFTYPGTLWCGAGNMADHYDQLGEFAETDSCCRIHDHCPHVIHAFSSNYGHTNFKWHSICHCDCDNALKSCLRKVNDTSSRVVGQAFFNVIGVPCFEFAYEEQCAERHWYGLCKRFEKVRIAVLQEAVPYDFGGIEVIDKLPVGSPKKEDSKKSKEEEKPESTTESTMSSPEEPSLRKVVNAAEDFIKVLATVSTSQSSTTDSEKGETQSSEKKKRKNKGKKKKTSKKQKGKGKGRKRKQKAEEGAAVSPSGSRAEEVIALSNFINESHKHNQSSRNTNSVDDSEYTLGAKEEPFNEVMKDEPAMEKETVSITSPTTVQKKPAESTEEIVVSTPTTTTTVIPHEAKTRRLRKWRRKKSKKILLTSSEELVTNTADNLKALFVTTIITISPTAQPEQQSFAVTTASTPIVIPKVKKNRSKERGDREGRKNRRKVSLASSIVAAAHENSSADNLRVIPLTGAPTIPLAPATERQVSHRMDVYEKKMAVHVTALNSSFSVLKRQDSKGLRSRMRKTVLPLSSENPLFHNSSVNVLPILPTPDTTYALKSPPTTSAEERETHSEWRLFTTITAAPPVITKRHRQQRKPRKKAMPAALREGVSIPEQTPMIFTTTPSKVATSEKINLQRSEKPCVSTSAIPVMSPIQLSIERAKAQFSRKKKRRKAALSVRQQ
ncbi:hypothetical protein PFLUV_G00024560 [Perca fluviatilis]|uniref:Phospholipase A2-like central domain-containing protein n=1 Tax=Perca fluviatilis TaxID=8168 RepID=A0A6A5EWS4_PERFL|nr:uncharacterized protein proca1 [Perca fluviatilis]KAF1394247.1 hypothetical protein PFLUV_G00024560 [Perca fluviatilis]